MDATEIAMRLYGAASEVVAREGLAFGAGAEIDIRNLADRASGLILRREPVDPGRLVDPASASFAALAERMLEGRNVIPGYIAMNPGVAGEETLAYALNFQTSLGWPFGDGEL